MTEMHNRFPQAIAYPTFHFHADRGWIVSTDAGLPAEVGLRVSELVKASEARVVFAPLGICRHVDHLIARWAVEHLGLRTVFYSDFPHSEQRCPTRFIRRSAQPWFLIRGALVAPRTRTGWQATGPSFLVGCRMVSPLARRFTGYLQRTQPPSRSWLRLARC